MFAIIDLETTGNAASNEDRIIEIGIVILGEHGKVVEEFSTFVYPERDIPPFITSLTGIKEDDVLDAPLFSEIADTINRLLKGQYIVAHNIEFDLGFINEEFKRIGYPVLHNAYIDTVELSRIMLPTAPSFKLGKLAEFLGFGHDRPHRALSDAQVTADLLRYLIEQMDTLPERTLEYLLKLEQRLKSEWRPLLQKAIDVKRYTIIEDSFELWHGIPVKKVDQSKNKTHVPLPDFDEWMEEVYESDKGLLQGIKGYEKRTGQKEMTAAVYKAFVQNKHAMIEAGTGTGKSIAYLLASFYYACKHKERIMITTHTNSLQKQLLEDEFPILNHMFGDSIEAVLYKGKAHYISLIHFKYELDHSYNDNYDIALTKAILLVWLTMTSTGDVDEIQLPSNGLPFWHRVSSDQAGKSVQLDGGAYSFYQRALMKAKEADLLITNHALLCMDLVSKEGRLPDFTKLIIDEAHHLETVAGRYFGVQFNHKELQRQLTQLTDLYRVKSFKGYQLEPAFFQHLYKCQRSVDVAKEELNHFSKYLSQHVRKMRRNSHGAKNDIGRVQYVINEETSRTFLEAAEEMSGRFLSSVFTLKQQLVRIGTDLKSAAHFREDKELLVLLSRIQSQIDFCQKTKEQIAGFFHMNPAEVKWMEIEGQGASKGVYLFSEPLHISDVLKSRLFHKKESVVLTSATLTANQSFDYMKRIVGLDECSSLIEESFPSPYNYKNQVRFMVPNDFPSIKTEPGEFTEALSEAIYSIAQVTRGRMLVLFTSYEMLKRTYLLLKDFIDPEEYMIFAQGISSGSRDRLKKNFQTFDQAILLGTSSFWEGVDIPGEDLSCVVMARLPFQPPHHPLFSMREKDEKEKGRNPFMEQSLPQAIIRFKQGFGRLIRSQKDRGIVFVCDARIIEARYGKYFISSIPDLSVHYDSTRSLVEKIDSWL